MRILLRVVKGLIASLLLASCTSQWSDTLRSPSGKFVVSYNGGGSEMDAAYYFSGPGDKIGFSICSGGDTPFDRSRFIWSSSERTLVVLQAEDGKAYDRFVLVRPDKDQDGASGNIPHVLIRMKPLENRYFEGKVISVRTVSDSDVVFLSDDGRVKSIDLEELRTESLRQEGFRVR